MIKYGSEIQVGDVIISTGESLTVTKIDRGMVRFHHLVHWVNQDNKSDWGHLPDEARFDVIDS